MVRIDRHPHPRSSVAEIVSYLSTEYERLGVEFFMLEECPQTIVTDESYLGTMYLGMARAFANRPVLRSSAAREPRKNQKTPGTRRFVSLLYAAYSSPKASRSAFSST